jgi:hypothetical protein
MGNSSSWWDDSKKINDLRRNNNMDATEIPRGGAATATKLPRGQEASAPQSPLLGTLTQEDAMTVTIKRWNSFVAEKDRPSLRKNDAMQPGPCNNNGKVVVRVS